MKTNNHNAATPKWVPVRPTGWVRLDTVVALSHAGNKYRLRTADGVWHTASKATLEELRQLGGVTGSASGEAPT